MWKFIMGLLWFLHAQPEVKEVEKAVVKRTIGLIDYLELFRARKPDGPYGDFTEREMEMIRALEMIATGRALTLTDRENWKM